MPILRFSTVGKTTEETAEAFAQLQEEAKQGKGFLVMELEQQPRNPKQQPPEPSKQAEPLEPEADLDEAQLEQQRQEAEAARKERERKKAVQAKAFQLAESIKKLREAKAKQ